jgi:hypothetical protein
VAWSPLATSRRRGWPPATPPPRAAHAATAQCALSHAATVQRRSINPFLDSSCQLAILFPLPPTAFLGGDHLLGASPLRPTSSLVFAFPSTTAPWGTSPTSPSSPMSTPPTSHRSSPSDRVHRRREPTKVSLPPCKSPNWVPPLEPVPRQFLLRPRPLASRISPASRRHRGGGSPPLFPRVGRNSRGSWAVLDRAPFWSGPAWQAAVRPGPAAQFDHGPHSAQEAGFV